MKLAALFSLSSMAWAYEPVPKTHGVLPAIYAYGSHFLVGQTVGYAMRAQIQERIEQQSSMSTLMAWIATPSGSAALNALLVTANSTYPEFIDEIDGMAIGSGQDFTTMFVMNVRNELESFMEADTGKELFEVEHCSDYMLMTSQGGFIGHNEDGGVNDRGTAFLVTAHVFDDAKYPLEETELWTAFTYAGELSTDAYFFNYHQVGSTMNGLYPSECLYGGLGRNFVSRDMMRAKDMDDLIDRAIQPNQATGHNFNLFSVSENRIVTMEIAPGVYNFPTHEVLYSFKEISTGDDAFFHANTYIELTSVEQETSVSSLHRMARASEMKVPTTATDILLVLGDEEDAEYPIYRTASGCDGSYTLTTAMVDLAREEMIIYLENPYEKQEARMVLGMHLEA